MEEKNGGTESDKVRGSTAQKVRMCWNCLHLVPVGLSCVLGSWPGSLFFFGGARDVVPAVPVGRGGTAGVCGH